MYIRRFEIRNIRALRELEWEIPPEKAAGWHVLLGDNGSGKSSVLRALALAFVGAEEAPALRQDWGRWLRRGTDSASVHLELVLDDERHFDTPPPGARDVSLELTLQRTEDGVHLESRGGAALIKVPKWMRLEGWFSASYGPFRRFTGGELESEALSSLSPKLARHLSVFDERIALTESLTWLKLLKFKELASSADPETIVLGPLQQFINQPGFLPHDTRLKDITPNGVLFVDGNGCEVPVEELSDGYRSILSMTFELIRQLAATYDPADLFVRAPEEPNRLIVQIPGVVLIDEVDAHLHPTWQHEVGLWFRRHFPYIQFIVTTHSPLICQAAEVGTVWRLPRPGSGEAPREITGVELSRLVYGNVLEAYGTGVFGEGVERSESSRKRLYRLAELNTKELREGLSEAERQEQEELRASQPTSAMTSWQPEAGSGK